jgi:DNA-binding MarR family transcriptional regulator
MGAGARNFDDARRLGHLLWEVGARAGSLTESALAGLPLTPASAGVLDVVAASPGASIAEISRWLPTSHQGVSRLERLGFLERRLGARGYGVSLFITDTGASSLLDANERLADAERRLVEALGAEEHDELVSRLDRARVLLEALEAQPEARAPGELPA